MGVLKVSNFYIYPRFTVFHINPRAPGGWALQSNKRINKSPLMTILKNRMRDSINRDRVKKIKTNYPNGKVMCYIISESVNLKNISKNKSFPK